MKGVKYARNSSGDVITAKQFAEAAGITQWTLWDNIKLLKEVLKK